MLGWKGLIQFHHNIKDPHFTVSGSEMQSKTHFCPYNPKKKDNLPCVEDI